MPDLLSCCALAAQSVDDELWKSKQRSLQSHLAYMRQLRQQMQVQWRQQARAQLGQQLQPGGASLEQLQREEVQQQLNYQVGQQQVQDDDRVPEVSPSRLFRPTHGPFLIPIRAIHFAMNPSPPHSTSDIRLASSTTGLSAATCLRCSAPKRESWARPARRATYQASWRMGPPFAPRQPPHCSSAWPHCWPHPRRESG